MSVNVERNLRILRKRIIELRREENLTQQRLSEELGIARSSLASWEIGDRLPNAKQLLKISEYFDVTTDYLLGFVEKKCEYKD